MRNPRSFVAALGLLWPAICLACESPQLQAEDAVKVIAKLGVQPITNRDVDFQLGRLPNVGIEPLPPLAPAVLQSTIYLIAQQRQALQTLRSRKLAVGREDVERWLEENGQPKSGERLTADAIVRQRTAEAGITESALRDHLAFRLSWKNYVQQQLTEANIAKHFENQPKRFDGTRFKISVADVATPAGKSTRRELAIKTLSDLRRQLVNKELVWEKAAEELTGLAVPPTPSDSIRVREGLWVRGTGDLDPSIVTAVLKLAVDAVSDPIQTPTGVHLVQLHVIETGNKKLTDVRDEVRAHMLMHLLDYLARQSDPQLTLQAAE